jgi:sialic acid synthase
MDNTVCHFSRFKNYALTEPNLKNIQKVNELYDKGHTIIIWTARGNMTGKNWFEITYDQLNKWNVKFHELRMNKPNFDILIDDKVLNSISDWNLTNVNKILYGNKPLEYKLTEEIYIGDKHPCLIIADIGKNHQGDLNIAKQLIKMAKDCGADVAQFQKSDLNSEFNKSLLNIPYNSIHSFGKTYGEHKKLLEFTKDEFLEMQKYSEEIGILFSASGMDTHSIDLLNEINIPFFKIGSSDISNLEFLEYISKKAKPIILSTGISDLESVKKSLAICQKYNNTICLLQGTTSYPLPDDQVNLSFINTYKNEFGHNTIIGHSGYEDGISLTLASVAMGVKIVEKHITLDKTLKGNYHSVSLDPSELKYMCQEIRKIETAIGNCI